MYQDKLALLKKQLIQLNEGTLPDYMKKLRKLDQTHKERLTVNDTWKDIQKDKIEKDFVKEKKQAVKEFEVICFLISLHISS